MTDAKLPLPDFRLDHTMLRVKDLERSLDYEECTEERCIILIDRKSVV